MRRAGDHVPHPDAGRIVVAAGVPVEDVMSLLVDYVRVDRCL